MGSFSGLRSGECVHRRAPRSTRCRGTQRDFRPQLDCAERTAIVHLADILSRAEAFGSGGDRRIPRLDPLALNLLGMDVKDVQAVMGRMNDELTDIPRM